MDRLQIKQPVYHSAMIDEMLELCKRYHLSEVTFPVRACYVRPSWPQLQRLLDAHPHYSLTVWTNKQDNHVDTAWLRANLPADRTFFDLPS